MCSILRIILQSAFILFLGLVSEWLTRKKKKKERKKRNSNQALITN